MATKTVSWTSFGRLSCSGCTPADVILCTTFNDATVPAQLISSQRLSTGCGGGYFQYTFSYDTADLPEGVTGLTCANITNAFCKGCLTTWVDNQIAEAIANLDIDVTAEIAAAIAAARPLIFSDQEVDDTFSFLADPTTSHDVDLVIANPSATRPLEVDISWGWEMEVQADDEYNDVTMTGTLRIDGVDTSDGTTNFRWSLTGIPSHIGYAGPAGHHHLTVAAGGSVTATLRMTSTVTSPAPDQVFAANKMFISAYGVTS